VATELTIPLILQIGKLSQPLSNVANQKNTLFKGATLDQRLPRTIYEVWKPISLRYAANPSDTTLRGMAEYLLKLCGPYALQAQQIINNLGQGPLTITGPSNQSVLVGATAVFSISVTSALPYTVQWFLNGVAIPGATGTTYSKINCQVANSGGVFTAQVTNGGAPVVSNTATLTVTASLVADYYYGSTDYSTQLNGGTDNVAFLGTFPITTGQPLSFTWPSGAANNQFIVVRYPATETTKTQYANAPLNNGLIPSIAFDNVVTIGSKKYIFSRNGNPFSQNTSAPLIFS
jgi:hypothetical protein